MTVHITKDSQAGDYTVCDACGVTKPIPSNEWWTEVTVRTGLRTKPRADRHLCRLCEEKEPFASLVKGK